MQGDFLKRSHKMSVNVCKWLSSGRFGLISEPLQNSYLPKMLDILKHKELETHGDKCLTSFFLLKKIKTILKWPLRCG